MNNSRREFIQTSALAASMVGLGSAAGCVMARQAAAGSTAEQDSSKKLKILILGGTRFLGPALVESALDRGHELTLFNRGRSNPHMFPEIEKLKGNRDSKIDDGLSALKGREWDAVVDTSGYITRHVRESAKLLSDAVRQYLFISTISVYADASQHGINEQSSVGEDLHSSSLRPSRTRERAIERGSAPASASPPAFRRR